MLQNFNFWLKLNLIRASHAFWHVCQRHNHIVILTLFKLIERKALLGPLKCTVRQAGSAKKSELTCRVREWEVRAKKCLSLAKLKSMKLAIKIQLTWPNAWEPLRSKVSVPPRIISDRIGSEWIGTGTEGVCKRVPHNWLWGETEIV